MTIMPAVSPEYSITDVWASNLEAEFAKVRQLVLKYNYVAMVSLSCCSYPLQEIVCAGH